MRIVFIADLAAGGTPRGGVQHATTRVVEAMRATGADVRVLSPDPGIRMPTPDETYPFPVTRVPMTERYQLLRGFRPWTRGIGEVLRAIGPDVVVGVGVLHNAAAAVGWAGCPRVVIAHGDALADAAWGYPRPLAAGVAPLLRAAVSRSVRAADLVVGVSPDWRANLPVEPRAFEYVPNPVDEVFFDDDGLEPAMEAGSVPAQDPAGSPGPARSCGAGDAPRIVFFGGPRRIKGADLLCAAWPMVRDAHEGLELHLYGFSDGLLPAGIPDPGAGVSVHAATPAPAIAHAMTRAGAVVVPSRFEVSPLVIAEAWARGVPVVATDVGGVRAMAGSAAILCEPTAASLASALERALRGGPEVDALVAEGRTRAADHRADRVAARHLALCEKLVGR